MSARVTVRVAGSRRSDATAAPNTPAEALEAEHRLLRENDHFTLIDFRRQNSGTDFILQTLAHLHPDAHIECLNVASSDLTSSGLRKVLRAVRAKGAFLSALIADDNPLGGQGVYNPRDPKGVKILVNILTIFPKLEALSLNACALGPTHMYRLAEATQEQTAPHERLRRDEAWYRQLPPLSKDDRTFGLELFQAYEARASSRNAALRAKRRWNLDAAGQPMEQRGGEETVSEASSVGMSAASAAKARATSSSDGRDASAEEASSSSAEATTTAAARAERRLQARGHAILGDQLVLLSLHSNFLGSWGTLYLAKAIDTHPYLEGLNISSCRITGRSVQPLAVALFRCRNLTELNISHNDRMDRNVYLCWTVRLAPSLCRLNLSFVPLAESTLTFLLHCASLTSVHYQVSAMVLRRMTETTYPMTWGQIFGPPQSEDLEAFDKNDNRGQDSDSERDSDDGADDYDSDDNFVSMDELLYNEEDVMGMQIANLMGQFYNSYEMSWLESSTNQDDTEETELMPPLRPSHLTPLCKESDMLKPACLSEIRLEGLTLLDHLAPDISAAMMSLPNLDIVTSEELIDETVWGAIETFRSTFAEQRHQCMRSLVHVGQTRVLRHSDAVFIQNWAKELLADDLRIRSAMEHFPTRTLEAFVAVGGLDVVLAERIRQDRDFINYILTMAKSTRLMEIMCAIANSAGVLLNHHALVMAFTVGQFVPPTLDEVSVPPSLKSLARRAWRKHMMHQNKLATAFVTDTDLKGRVPGEIRSYLYYGIISTVPE